MPAFREVAPQLMDLLALISSLAVAASMAPVLAISYDDMLAADARYSNATGRSVPHEVSGYIKYLTITSTGFGILSVILAVGVRATLALLPSEVNTGNWLVIPAFLSFTFFNVSMVAFTFNTSWYWWVMMPVSVAGEVGTDIAGFLFILAFIGLVLYFLIFVFCFRKSLPRSLPDRAKKVSLAA